MRISEIIRAMSQISGDSIVYVNDGRDFVGYFGFSVGQRWEDEENSPNVVFVRGISLEEMEPCFLVPNVGAVINIFQSLRESQGDVEIINELTMETVASVYSEEGSLNIC